MLTNEETPNHKSGKETQFGYNKLFAKIKSFFTINNTNGLS